MYLSAIGLEISPGWMMAADIEDLKRWKPNEIMPTIMLAIAYAEKTASPDPGQVLISNDVVIQTSKSKCVALVLRFPANHLGVRGHVWIGTPPEVEEFRREQAKLSNLKMFTIQTLKEGEK